MSFRRPVIIDTDAGVDDAVALMVLLNTSSMDVKAITTVTGNVSVDKVTRNVGLLLAFMDRNIPLYAGAALPLWGQPMNSEDIMAADGLGGASTQFAHPARQPEPGSAAAALVRLANEYEHQPEFTLIALGPLTNLALAVRLDPGFAARVAHLVVMGGAVHGQGNTSAAAEFNIYADPEAAQIVFSAGFKDVALLPWETSLKTPLLWDDYARLASLPTPNARLFAAITQSLSVLLREQLHTPGYILPDLHAAAAALDAGIIIQERPGILAVDTAFGSGRGLTSVRWQFDQGSSANVRVLEEIDSNKILEYLTVALNG